MFEGQAIHDVKLIPLVSHRDKRGFFREVFRVRESEFGSIKQISHSLVHEGVRKGWHAHVYQSQWNYVVSGELRVVLIDHRNDSPTFRNMMSFIASEEHHVGYIFKPGILHGYHCIKGPTNIIYGTSGMYDLSDEVRIPLEEYSQSYI